MRRVGSELPALVDLTKRKAHGVPGWVGGCGRGPLSGEGGRGTSRRQPAIRAKGVVGLTQDSVFAGFDVVFDDVSSSIVMCIRYKC